MARKKNKKLDENTLVAATWYNLKALAEGVMEINIFDEIGWMGVEASQFIREIQNADPDRIVMRVNSPGGDVFEGLAIYNFLNELDASIEVKVEGIAASIASIIIQAGDIITIPENAFIMVHEPMVGSYGNRAQLRKAAETLDKITASMNGIYQKATGLNADEVSDIMENETWLNGDEAVDKGFATNVVESQAIAASFDIKKLREVPAAAKVLFNRNEGEYKAMKPEPKNDAKVKDVKDAKTDAPLQPPEPKAAEPVAPVAKADDAGNEPAPAPAKEPEKTDDGRGEFRAFQAAFGDDAGEYFGKGLTLEEAKDEHMKALASRNKELEEQAKAQKPADGDGNPAAAFDSSDGDAPKAKPIATLAECKAYCKKTGGDPKKLYAALVAKAQEEAE